MMTVPVNRKETSDEAAAREASAIVAERLELERKRWQLRPLDLTEPGIYIVSKIDGFRRAGIEHHGFKRYALDAFTGTQLSLLVTDKHIEVFSIGGEPIPRTGGLPEILPIGAGVRSRDTLDRAHEAAVAEDTGAADAGIKGGAARDLARESTRSRASRL